MIKNEFKTFEFGQKRQNYENITVVPILSDTDTPFDVLDLKKGLKMGLVTIGECDSTNVEKVK